jgi:hypothetical protein
VGQVLRFLACTYVPLPFCLCEAVSSAGRRVFLANTSFRFSIPSLSILDASCSFRVLLLRRAVLWVSACVHCAPPPRWVRPPSHSTRLTHYIFVAYAYNPRFVFHGSLKRVHTPRNLGLFGSFGDSRTCSTRAWLRDLRRNPRRVMMWMLFVARFKYA